MPRKLKKVNVFYDESIPIIRLELSVVEATRRLGVAVDATYKLIYAGKLAARKVDGRWLIRADAVEERVKAREERRQRYASSPAANSELARR